jgi:hypothetical protein
MKSAYATALFSKQSMDRIAPSFVIYIGGLSVYVNPHKFKFNIIFSSIVSNWGDGVLG